MRIESLQLKQYRNYEQLTLRFSEEVNIFIGENAQGKTNVMEAIYVLAMAKSHRTNVDRELIQWEQSYGKIEGTIRNRYGNVPLSLLLSKKGKTAKVNHLEQQRLSDYIGAFNVVMFAPEDLNIVKGSPRERRRFIDMEIGQISAPYLYDLMQFQQLLKQRNALLKQVRGRMNDQDHALFDVYTEQFAQLAARVVYRRFGFIAQLQKWADPIHYRISKEKEHLTIHYETLESLNAEMSVEQMERVILDKLKTLTDRELQRGTTLVGPHRDDLTFYVNDYDVQTYGSQGQQRTAALSLKLAEIQLIEEKVGEPPVLLLDDVLSELDDERQTHLLNTMKGHVQTFVTTTSVAGIDHETIQRAKVFHVDQGHVTDRSRSNEEE